MSFVVAIRIQLEGDAEIFREMIIQYREDCLANESCLLYTSDAADE